MALQDNSPPRADRLLKTLLLFLAVLWCVYWFVHAWHYWEDDAYIHLEFARSVAAGRGFAFNGKVVSGDTAPLWVLLLVAMHLAVPDWLIAGKVLTVLGTVVGLTGVYAFARRLCSHLPHSALVPAAMVLLVVANPYFCYWAFSGMEPLAAAGVGLFGTLAATQISPSRRSFLLGCVLAGIAPLLRPEMVFLTGILSLVLLAQWVRLPGKGTAPGKLSAFVMGLVLLATPLTAWSFYSHSAFGRFIPNTNAAKRAAAADSVPHHLLNVYALGLPLILCGLLAGIVYLILRPSSVRRSLQQAILSVARPVPPAAALPLAGWIFLLWPAITTVFYIVNHTYVQTRYVLVTAPGLTVVIVVLALTASRRTGRVVYAAGLVAALAVSLIAARPFVRNKAIDCQLTHDVALYIRDKVPPDEPVAVYSIGELAFYSQHPIVDTGGITRPGAIAYLNQPPDAMLHWARSEGARYYVTDLKPEPGATLAYSVQERFLGWTFHTSRYDTTFPANLWKLAPAETPQQSGRGQVAASH